MTINNEIKIHFLILYKYFLFINYIYGFDCLFLKSGSIMYLINII